MAATSFYANLNNPSPRVTPEANMPPGPVPTSNTPVQSAPVNTPLHDAVKANPSITPEQIVVLHDKLTPDGAPPLSVQGAALVKQQALNPAATAPIAPNSGPFNAAQIASTQSSAAGAANAARLANLQKSIDSTLPNSYGSTPAAANANYLAAQQMAIDNAVPATSSSPAIATSPGPAPATPPPAPYNPNDISWLNSRNPATELPEFLQGGSLTPTTPGPNENEAPVSSATSAPMSTAPGAQPNHPSWLQSLGGGLLKAAPLIAGAVIGGSNPAAGAAALRGWKEGTQEVQARADQQAKIAKEDEQQKFENDLKTQGLSDDEAAKAATERQQFLDNLDKIDAKGQEQEVKGLSDKDAARLGIDKASFYDKDGNFIPHNPATKSYDPAGLARAQTTARGQLHQLTLDGQQSEHDRYAANPSQFELIYGEPYDTFKPTETSKSVLDTDKANSLKIARQARMLAVLNHGTTDTQQSIHDAYKDDPDGFKETYGVDYDKWKPGMLETDLLHQKGEQEIARHNTVTEGQGNRRLTLAEAQLKERAGHDKAMEAIGDKNATAHWISAHASQKRADDQHVFEAWKMNSGGGKADQSTKSIYHSPWGTIYDKAVAARDAASQRLLINRQYEPDKPDDPSLVDAITRFDAQIERMNHTAPPKITPRSQAFASGQVRGGASVSVDPQVSPSAKSAARQVGKVVPNNQTYWCGQWITNQNRADGGTKSVTELKDDPKYRVEPDANGHVPPNTIAYWPAPDKDNQHFARVIDDQQHVLESTQTGAPKGSRIIRGNRTVDDVTAAHGGTKPIFFRLDSGTKSSRSSGGVNPSAKSAAKALLGL